MLTVCRNSIGSGKMKKAKAISKDKLEKMLDKEWSKYILNRDKCCQKCGGKSALSPHHAFGRRHRATRWDIYNGVCLCYPCHLHWAHRDCGGFADWFRKHIGNYQYERLSEIHNQVSKHTNEDLQLMLEFFTKGAV